MYKYLVLSRYHHWIKNFLIFVPTILSYSQLNSFEILKLIILFASLSFLSSVVYVINDIKDVDQDRIHPKKRIRPIASGEISEKHAKYFLILLSIPIIISIYFLSNFYLLIIFILFFLNSFFYTFYFKKIRYFEILIVSLNYVLRIYAGALLLDITVTEWAILIVYLGSTYIFLSKRILNKNFSSSIYINENLSKSFLIKKLFKANLIVLCLLIIYYIFFINLILIPVGIIVIYILYDYYQKLNYQVDIGNYDPVDLLLKNRIYLFLLFVALIYMLMIYKLN